MKYLISLLVLTLSISLFACSDNSSASLSPVGLKAGSGALIKIKTGSTVQGEVIKTGYVLVSFPGPIEVHKLPLDTILEKPAPKKTT